MPTKDEAPLIPTPPARLSPPNTERLASGTPLHRTHLAAYVASSFNPGHGDDTRFAPIYAADGVPIPTLYAAASLDAAIFESVLHDVPVAGTRRRISYTRLVDRCYTAISPIRELTLATLFVPDLKRWNLTRALLIDSPTECYRRTARWAEAIHDQFPTIDGLVWTSRQCDEERAYLFFGDRVKEMTFSIPAPSRSLFWDSDLLHRVRECAARVGAGIRMPSKPLPRP